MFTVSSDGIKIKGPVKVRDDIQINAINYCTSLNQILVGGTDLNEKKKSIGCILGIYYVFVFRKATYFHFARKIKLTEWLESSPERVNM